MYVFDSELPGSWWSQLLRCGAAAKPWIAVEGALEDMIRGDLELVEEVLLGAESDADAIAEVDRSLSAGSLPTSSRVAGQITVTQA